MAAIENKVIQTQNDTEIINRTNELNSSFGWKVSNVQVTHNQNTSIYQDPIDYGSARFTVKTTTINYATITYSRDQGMENYDEIVRLENLYYEWRSRRENLRSEMSRPDFNGLKTYLMIMLWPIGIIYLLFFKKAKDEEKRKKEKEYRDSLKTIENAMMELEAKAKVLV